MTAREHLDQLDQLRAAGTPGDWEAELCEGELTVSAGSARTVWTDHDGFSIGSRSGSYRSTDRIYEHELEAWDADEPADKQRVADADLVVAAVNALPQHVAALRAVLDLADWLDSDDASDKIVDPDFYYGRSDAADRIRAAITAALGPGEVQS